MKPRTQGGTLPPGIEVFKPGRAISDDGRVWNFTEAHLADMAASYDPAVREAPITVGHPEHDKPAYGWAAKFAVNGDGNLSFDARQVEPAFAEMVAAGRFKKRSLALYPPEHPNNPKPGHWVPRHVAFLGAQPPAIAGLKDPEFADDGKGLVRFSEATHREEDRSMDKELQAQVDAEKARADAAEAEKKTALQAKADADAKLAKFAEAAKTQRHAEHVAFAEGAQKKGLLKTPEVAEAVAVLDHLGELQDSGSVQFTEGDATKKVSVLEFVKRCIDARKPLVSFSEQGGGGDPNALPRGASDAEIDKAAREYAAKHNLQYAEALRKVVSFTQA